MNILVPKSERIRSDRIRIGFGSDLHTSSFYAQSSKQAPLTSGFVGSILATDSCEKNVLQRVESLIFCDSTRVEYDK
jgi:hypothetical protein